jgi:hypothetical protein
VAADSAQAAALQSRIAALVDDIPGQTRVWVKLAGSSDHLQGLARAEIHGNGRRSLRACLLSTT